LGFSNLPARVTRVNTPVERIFVLKLPAFRGNAARLAVEINPADEAGRPCLALAGLVVLVSMIVMVRKRSKV